MSRALECGLLSMVSMEMVWCAFKMMMVRFPSHAWLEGHVDDHAE